jgi:hypothetical protein
MSEAKSGFTLHGKTAPHVAALMRATDPPPPFPPRPGRSAAETAARPAHFRRAGRSRDIALLCSARSDSIRNGVIRFAAAPSA